MKKRAKAMSSDVGRLGHWVFVIAVVIAILAGFLTLARGAVATSILVILGLVVGFVNITEKETMAYLLAAIALIIVAGLGNAVLGTVQYVGLYLQRILSAVIVFVIPATVIVALKAIYKIAAKK